MRVSWCNLHLWIPQRDVRKIIYGKLTKFERIVVAFAHCRRVEMYIHNNMLSLNQEAIDYFTRQGYVNLIKWFNVSPKNICPLTAIDSENPNMVEYILDDHDIVELTLYAVESKKSVDIVKLLFIDGCGDWRIRQDVLDHYTDDDKIRSFLLSLN